MQDTTPPDQASPLSAGGDLTDKKALRGTQRKGMLLDLNGIA
jgi:hypothetical protein